MTLKQLRKVLANAIWVNRQSLRANPERTGPAVVFVKGYMDGACSAYMECAAEHPYKTSFDSWHQAMRIIYRLTNYYRGRERL